MQSPIDIGAPIPLEVDRIAAVIMSELGQADLESAMTVLCSISGQVVAAVSEGRLGDVKLHVDNMAQNIHRVAIVQLEESRESTSDVSSSE